MKTYKYIPYIAFLAVLIFCLFEVLSCSADNETSVDEQGEIIVSFGSRMNLNDPTNPDFHENHRVNILRVFVFVNNILEKNVPYNVTDHPTDFANSFFCIPVKTGLKDVYVVANETEEMTSLFENIATKSDLSRIIIDKTQIVNANGTIKSDVEFLPMTGGVQNVLVTEITNNTPHVQHTPVAIKLTHLTARIDLMFDKMTDLDVKIKQVSILNNTQKSWLLPNTGAISAQSHHSVSLAPDYTFSAKQSNENGETIIADRSAELNKSPIYVFENIRGSNTTQLKIIAEVEGREMEYLATIGGGTIERGNHYVLYGRIWGGEVSPITLKVKVLAWIQRLNEPIEMN
jgi:hypothetical protein